MDSYSVLVVLICLSASFAYINHRFIKMPFVIGLFFLSTVLSLLIILAKLWDIPAYAQAISLVEKTDISHLILDIMLGFLLFAGALHTTWASMRLQIKPIAILAIGGVIFSTLFISGSLYAVCQLLHVDLGFFYCLIFGAIISPTDPIAVLGILTKANVPAKIESIVVGESLFNDGIGVVLFAALLTGLKSGRLGFEEIGGLFLWEAGGGVVFGLVLGFLLHKLLQSIDNYETEVLLTIAFVMLGYRLCSYIGISGALAMVIMGLLVGNYKIEQAMSETTLQYVLKFWSLLDVILNAILFVSIALVIVVLDLKSIYLGIGLSAVPIVLASRGFIVHAIRLGLPKTINLGRKEANLVVWGGLRGGLSIALVLSLPSSPEKPILMIATYACIVFSILIQGLTIQGMAKGLSGK